MHYYKLVPFQKVSSNLGNRCGLASRNQAVPGITRKYGDFVALSIIKLDEVAILRLALLLEANKLFETHDYE